MRFTALLRSIINGSSSAISKTLRTIPAANKPSSLSGKRKEKNYVYVFYI